MDDHEDISWYICTICYQAFTSVGRLRAHYRLTHDSKQNGLANVLILGQVTDLEPTIKIQKCAGFGHTEDGSGIRSSDANGADNWVESDELQTKSSISSDSADGDGLKIDMAEEIGRENEDVQEKAGSSGSGTTLSLNCSAVGSESGARTLLAISEEDVGCADVKEEPIVEVQEEPEQQVQADQGGALGIAPQLEFRTVASAEGYFRFGCTLCSKDYVHKQDMKRHVKHVHNSAREDSSRRRQPDPPQLKKKLEEGNDEFQREETVARSPRSLRPRALVAGSGDLTVHYNGDSSSDSHSLKSDDHWAISDASGGSLSLSGDDDEIGADVNEEINTEDKDRQSVQGPPRVTKKPTTLEYRTVKVNSADGSTPSVRLGCTLCSKDYTDLKGLARHVKNVHNSTKEVREGRTCPICQREYGARKDMLRHHREIHVVAARGEEHLCPTCGIRLKTPARLKGHQKRMHGPGERKASFECDVCGRAFLDAAVLKRHKLTHQPGGGDFICDQCGKRFRTVEEMNRHLKFIHAGFRPFKCAECGKGFVNKQVLDMHGAVHMDPELNPFPCTQCPKAFKTKPQLQIHVRGMHSGQSGQFHLCRVCGQQFRAKFTAMNHEHRKHNFQREEVETNRVECGVCKKTFLSSCLLKEHQVMHTNERPHKCATCGKGFKTKNGLDHHLKVSHRPNEELQHPCEVCGKRFGYASYLAKHKQGVHGYGKASGTDKTD